MRALFVKRAFRLHPADEAAELLMSKLRENELIAADVRRGRSLPHHRKFWKLMQIVADNQTHYADAEEVCTAFKFAVGHTAKLKTARGIVEYPLSISFAKMDQTAFEAFYDKAVHFLCSEVVPGLDSAALTTEVEVMLQDKVPA